MKKHFLLLVLPLAATILVGCGGQADERPDVAEQGSTVPGEKPAGQR